jgi:hypothetical protein
MVMVAEPAVSEFPLQTVALLLKTPAQISELLMVTKLVLEDVIVKLGALVSTFPLASTTFTFELGNGKISPKFKLKPGKLSMVTLAGGLVVVFL